MSRGSCRGYRPVGEVEVEVSSPWSCWNQRDGEVWRASILTQSVLSLRTFRIMDDDGSKSLSYDEFKKGVRDYGVGLTESVRYTAQLNILLSLSLSL